MEPPLLRVFLIRGSLVLLPFAVWFVWRWWARRSGHEMGSTPYAWLAAAGAVLAGLCSPYQTQTGFHITPVVGFVDPLAELTANADEVADIFETPLGFLMDPANHEEHHRETPAGDMRRFYAMTWEDRFIWGATAGMLRALYDRLYGAAVA